MAMANTFKVDWNGSFEWETSDPEVTLDPSINPYHNHKIGCRTCRVYLFLFYGIFINLALCFKKRIEKMTKREAKAYRVDTAPQNDPGAIDNDMYVLFFCTKTKIVEICFYQFLTIIFRN